MGLNAQVRSQTSEQDEASFERRRRQLLGESWGMPPPPPIKFWNLEAQKLSLNISNLY